MKLIVGLGNPEIRYAFTRHNTGFLAIDEILKRIGNATLDKDKFDGIFTKTTIEGEDVIIAKPMTYMNLSGEAVQALMTWYFSIISSLKSFSSLPVGSTTR